MKISVIIPCYNESKNLSALLMICQKLAERYSQSQFIFVNNGSTDDSEKVFSEIESRNKAFCVVNIPKNIGYGNGILQGLTHAKGDIVAWTHADLQTNPEDIFKACQFFEKKLNQSEVVVKGKRIHRPLFDAFFTAGMSILASVMLRVRLNDINAQPKIFHKSLIMKLLDNAPQDFSLDTWLLYRARKKHIPIFSYPVYYDKRVAGDSKGGGSLYGKLKLTMRTLAFLFFCTFRKDK